MTPSSIISQSDSLHEVRFGLETSMTLGTEFSSKHRLKETCISIKYAVYQTQMFIPLEY